MLIQQYTWVCDKCGKEEKDEPTRISTLAMPPTPILPAGWLITIKQAEGDREYCPCFDSADKPVELLQ